MKIDLYEGLAGTINAPRPKKKAKPKIKPTDPQSKQAPKAPKGGAT